MLHLQGSHFSNASSTRTEPDPRALVGTTDPTATDPPEIVTTVKVKVEDSAGGSGSNTVAIIIGLAVALIALVGKNKSNIFGGSNIYLLWVVLISFYVSMEITLPACH